MGPEELIALIERAFPTHPVPLFTLRQKTLSDEGMSRDISLEEHENAGRIDRDVPWTALTDKDLIECEAGLPHLAATEFSYYLGALLRFAVRHLDAPSLTPEGGLVSTIMFVLTHNPPVKAAEYVSRLWYEDALDVDQTEAVQQFLKYVTSHSGRFGERATFVLSRYWKPAGPLQ
jgi:hypothetical protein